MEAKLAEKKGIVRKGIDVTIKAWEAIQEAKRLTGKTLSRCQSEAFEFYLDKIKKEQGER